MRRSILAFLPVAVTILLIWALQTKMGDIPALGRFLNPCDGFWLNAESKTEEPVQRLLLNGLRGKVVIRFDSDRIPHVFAENDHDLYFSQGYLTAKDRLWQMDIQTRSASGRLAEVVGAKALDLDRYHRRMGMVPGAERTLSGMMKDPESRLAITAYSEGVNAYIDALKPADYPLEYKLLNYAPERWKPINSAFLLKLMSEVLAGGSDQFAMSNTLGLFGADVMKDLFPDHTMHEEPIIPKGTPWNFKPLSLPPVSVSFRHIKGDSIRTNEIIEGIGSNNWAVSGKKTASGFPILANDPHLNLTFPSIWYEIQLNAPGVNVYGVSLPGAPCIIIGFNDRVSWGVTNVDADILDWYQIRFKDKAKTSYWYNGAWQPLKRRLEFIHIRGGKTECDTVYYTSDGPIVYESLQKKSARSPANIPVGSALRWVAHDESDEIRTFYLLNRAKNFEEYRMALAYYSAPAQNFVFASSENDIALTVNGKFPLKYRDQGKFILDGSEPADKWHGWIPFEQNPFVKNPGRGFISSANQTSTDSSYPYYLNWRFGPYERGKRINDRLTGMKKATIDSMRLLQLDTYSIRANDMMPVMLEALDADKMSSLQKQALFYLKNWNKYYTIQSIGATIFDRWWLKFYDLTWDEFNDRPVLLKRPSMDRTEELLIKTPESHWFDNKSTPEKENSSMLLNRSFTEALNELITDFGKPGQNWRWGKVRRMEISHIAHIPGLGSGNFESPGTGSTVDALSGGHGPSWRMVVEMGPHIKAFGILPGGESGNPGSFFYNNMLKTWQTGGLNSLLFLHSPAESSKSIHSTLFIQK